MMPLIHLGKNSLWLLLARIGTQGLAVLFTVLLARRLGSTGMGAYALLNLCVSLLQVLAAWLFTGGSQGLVVLAVLLLAVQGIAALLAGTLVSVLIAGFWRGWRFSWQEFRDVVMASAPLGLLGLLGILYQKLSLTLLSFLGGAALAGWFSAAQRAVEAAKTGHLAVFTAVYPAMAQAQANSDGKTTWSMTLQLSWKLLISAAALAALALSLFAAPLG